MSGKQYLTMEDVFCLPVDSETSEFYCSQSDPRNIDLQSDYAAHAVSSHDELVAEVELLRDECDALSLHWDDIQRLVKALSWLGYSTPESQEEQSASQKRLALNLIRAVEKNKAFLTAPLVTEGWQLVADATLRRAIVSLIDRVNPTLSCNETAVEQLRFMNEIAAAPKLEGE